MKGATTYDNKIEPVSNDEDQRARGSPFCAVHVPRSKTGVCMLQHYKTRTNT